MRVAILTDGIAPYVIGGMQKHSFYLTKYFAINKIEVDLYHCANSINEDIEQLNCFSKEEKKYIRSVIIPFPKSGFIPGHYIRESFEYSNRIFQSYKKQRQTVDFIYSQGFCGWKMIIEKSNGIPLPPIGVNFHGLEMFQKPANFKSKIEQYLFRKPVLSILKNADVVFSLGGKLSEILIRNKILKNKTIQIPIGIDESWMKNDPVVNHPKTTFIFVGRYERRKGIEELTEVLYKIRNKNFEFHFIGAIPKKKQIKASNIYYWGSISDVEQLKEIYQKADVLVCPSYSEGMPTVILEAMASGLAIIASDVGAIDLLVGTDNGILIESGNSIVLENSFRYMLEIDRTELKKMKKKSIEKVQQQFLWGTIIKIMINYIQNIEFNKTK